jgi:predicted N-acetyltransferase YhbS
MTVTYGWRGSFNNAEVNALHAEAFDHQLRDDDWSGRAERHSLGWVCARDNGDLIGFVNVAWDSGMHAFILDPIVATDKRGQGIGTRLIEAGLAGARSGGCDWLHVDFDDDLQDFYFGACGFVPTSAGLIRLR